MRELHWEEVEATEGAVLPVMFVAAVALSQVSWTSVGFMAGAMTGAAVTGAVIYNER